MNKGIGQTAPHLQLSQAFQFSDRGHHILFHCSPAHIYITGDYRVYLCVFLYVLHFFKTIILGEPVHGFPTLIIVILFLGGIQLLSLGIIGEYLGRIFIETKHRPVYIINEKEGV